MRARSRSLLWIIGIRVFAFALLAMVIQTLIVVYDYWNSYETISRKVQEMLVSQLTSGFKLENGKLHFALPPELAERYSQWPADRSSVTGGYFAYVHDGDGNVFFSNCITDYCSELQRKTKQVAADSWYLNLAPGKPLTFAGGKKLHLLGKEIHFTFGIVRDPDSLIYRAILHELYDHMAVPMILLLVIVMGATMFSVRSALKPVLQASSTLNEIDVRSSNGSIDPKGMPIEIAAFVEAINRTIARIAELMKGQKIFASAISHEIRTPLAIVRMELEQIDHPRARKSMADLDNLTRLVEQLSALARLDAVEVTSLSDTNLSELAHNVCSSVAPFVYANGMTLEFKDKNAGIAKANPGLIENLLRNLIENSVRHNEAGIHIVVVAGPGTCLAVEDSGNGFSPSTGDGGLVSGTSKAAGGVGLGLQIVQRIADLHGAKVTKIATTPRGTTIKIQFK